jgi:hypothetical protein
MQLKAAGVAIFLVVVGGLLLGVEHWLSWVWVCNAVGAFTFLIAVFLDVVWPRLRGAPVTPRAMWPENKNRESVILRSLGKAGLLLGLISLGLSFYVH